MHKSLVGLTISNIKYFLHNEICLKEFCDDYEHQNQKMSTLIFEMQSTLFDLTVRYLQYKLSVSDVTDRNNYVSIEGLNVYFINKLDIYNLVCATDKSGSLN
jgi:hypothetical protein